MWIKSQNGSNLVNTDYIYCRSSIVHCMTNSESICLGCYDSIQRAEEVLNEIEMVIGTKNNGIYVGDGTRTKVGFSTVYEMPEK